MNQPFRFPNGQLAYNADELLELCQQFPVDGTNYLIKKDLEFWLSYIGKDDIAQCATSARQSSLEDRQKLEEFLNKYHALVSPERQSSISEIPEVKEDVVTESTVVETQENSTSTVNETPSSISEISEVKEDAVVKESTVIETQENPTPAVEEISQVTSVNNPSSVAKATKSPVTEASSPKIVKSSGSSSSSSHKPSFFQVIARLIVSIFYGNKS